MSTEVERRVISQKAVQAAVKAFETEIHARLANGYCGEVKLTIAIWDGLMTSSIIESAKRTKTEYQSGPHVSPECSKKHNGADYDPSARNHTNSRRRHPVD